MKDLGKERIDRDYVFINPNDLTFREWNVIVFNYFWRSLVVASLTIFSMIIISFILAVFLLPLGIELWQDLTGLLILVLGFGFFVVFPMTWIVIKWVLRSKMGHYRTALLRDTVDFKFGEKFQKVMQEETQEEPIENS